MVVHVSRRILRAVPQWFFPAPPSSGRRDILLMAVAVDFSPEAVLVIQAIILDAVRDLLPTHDAL